MAGTAVVKSNQNSVKTIFHTMEYGPAPESENIAKVNKLAK